MGDCSEKPIEKIQIGDWVWAEDPETGEKGARQVTAVIVGQGQKELVEIEIDGHVIIATDEHPFWVASRGEWIDAEDLQVGDDLLTEDGTFTDVDRIATYVVPFQTVYNLTIQGLHTYYVLAGNRPVLVHNIECRGGRHGDTRLPRGDGLDSNHSPAASVSPLRRGDGPAWQMRPEDHRRMSSTGSSREAREWRERQRRLIEEGRFREAMQMDIDEARRLFGDRYDQAIREMLDYADGL